MIINPVINQLQQGISLAPSSVALEVIQNVRMIVTTVRGSVPLYRDFGIDPTIIDAPTQIAEAKLSTDIIRQVRKYEPRAQITNLTFQQTTDGHTTPHISITVKEK